MGKGAPMTQKKAASVTRLHTAKPADDDDDGVLDGAEDSVKIDLRPNLRADRGNHSAGVEYILENIAATEDGVDGCWLHGDSLVDWYDDRNEGKPIKMQPLEIPTMQTLASRRIFFFRVDQNGNKVEISPPAALIQSVLKAIEKEQYVHRIDRIAYAPFFTKDGRLISADGSYNPNDKVLVSMGKHLAENIPEIPSRPTLNDVRNAKKLVLSMIQDFPFVGKQDNKPLSQCGDRASALALMFLPFVREMIAGPTPLHNFDAPSARTGKSLLVKTLLYPGYGRKQEVIPAPAKSEELEKTVGSALIEGRPVITIDNINHKLFSGSLASFITNYPDSTIRVLGKSATKIAPAPTAWVSTANNLSASEELAKRIAPCMLDARSENPEQDRAYAIEDLLQWSERNRGELIAAVCVIVRAWVQKGSPDGNARLGGFEDWARVMSGILESIGVNGLLLNRKAFLENANAEAEEWSVFFTEWLSRTGWTDEWVPAKDLADMVSACGFEDALGIDARGNVSMQLGRRLGQRRGTVFGGRRLLDKRGNTGAKMWILESTEAPEVPKIVAKKRLKRRN